MGLLTFTRERIFACIVIVSMFLFFFLVAGPYGLMLALAMINLPAPLVPALTRREFGIMPTGSDYVLIALFWMAVLLFVTWPVNLIARKGRRKSIPRD